MPFRLGPYLAESTIGMGALGAIIGGTNVIAKNVEQVPKGTITESEAVKDIGKEKLKWRGYCCNICHGGKFWRRINSIRRSYISDRFHTKICLG